jgi:hypothetical protein
VDSLGVILSGDIKNMMLSKQRKGKKVLMNWEELQEYMSLKLNELTGLVSNMAIALLMTSLVVVFTFFRAGDMYFYAIILLPLAGRWYLGKWINKWLRKKFKELLYT